MAEPPVSAPPRPAPRLELLLLVATFATLHATVVRWPGVDFWRPWAASRVAAGGAAGEVYSRAGREALLERGLAAGTGLGPSRELDAARGCASTDPEVLGYGGINVVQTPWVLAAFSLLRSDDYDRDWRLFLALSIACFLGAAWALGRLAGLSTPVACVAAAALSLLLDAEAGELRVGNLNNVQLALLAAFLLLERRGRPWADAAGGAALALSLAVKPNMALVAPAVALAWAADRRWRQLARAALGAAAAAVLIVGLPAAIVPAASWRSWLEILPELLGGRQPLAFGNVSMAALVARGVGGGAAALLPAGGVVLLAVAAWRPARAARGEPRDRTLAAVAAGAALSLLSSPLVWVHYGVLALPALVLVLRRLADGGGVKRWALAASLLPAATGIQALLARADGSFTLAALALGATLLVLAGVALMDLAREGTAGVQRGDDGPLSTARS